MSARIRPTDQILIDLAFVETMVDLVGHQVDDPGPDPESVRYAMMYAADKLREIRALLSEVTGVLFEHRLLQGQELPPVQEGQL